MRPFSHAFLALQCCVGVFWISVVSLLTRLHGLSGREIWRHELGRRSGQLHCCVGRW